MHTKSINPYSRQDKPILFVRIKNEGFDYVENNRAFSFLFKHK